MFCLWFFFVCLFVLEHALKFEACFACFAQAVEEKQRCSHVFTKHNELPTRAVNKTASTSSQGLGHFDLKTIDCYVGREICLKLCVFFSWVKFSSSTLNDKYFQNFPLCFRSKRFVQVATLCFCFALKKKLFL